MNVRESANARAQRREKKPGLYNVCMHCMEKIEVRIRGKEKERERIEASARVFQSTVYYALYNMLIYIIMCSAMIVLGDDSAIMASLFLTLTAFNLKKNYHCN